jgi:putative phage-type endonuclease
MIIHDVLQRSPEWRKIRCGKIGASDMSAVLAKGKSGGESKTRKTLMFRVLAERLSGIPQETYCNSAMKWGTEHEPYARNLYEMEMSCSVKQVGFVEWDEYAGCSPDGFVGEDGLVEIKCPNTSTHLSYILANRMPPEYFIQVQSQMWITERRWCDFVSYDPRIPCKAFWMIRVERDMKKIIKIQDNVMWFIDELKEFEKQIRS